MLIEQINNMFTMKDVLLKYTKFKKNDNLLQAVCPSCKSKFLFAHEKEKSWHCYWCGNGGWIANFIMMAKDIDLEELSLLIEFNWEKIVNADNEYKMCTLLINEYQRFYRSEYNRKKAEELLLSRGISKEVCEQFKVWYAPETYDVRSDVLMKYHKMIFQKNKYGYNSFKDRIMFPFYWTNWQVVWYSGRYMWKDEKAPKYLNTGNTHLFNKSKVAFWLYQAMESIKQSNSVILCEGQFDVLSWHEVGYTQTIGVSWTALSNYLIKKLISLWVETFFLAFDFDEAGEKAKERAINMIRVTWKEIQIWNNFSNEKVKDMNDVIMQQELYNLTFNKYEWY